MNSFRAETASPPSSPRILTQRKERQSERICGNPLAQGGDKSDGRGEGDLRGLDVPVAAGWLGWRAQSAAPREPEGLGGAEELTPGP